MLHELSIFEIPSYVIYFRFFKTTTSCFEKNENKSHNNLRIFWSVVHSKIYANYSTSKSFSHVHSLHQFSRNFLELFWKLLQSHCCEKSAQRTLTGRPDNWNKPLNLTIDFFSEHQQIWILRYPPELVHASGERRRRSRYGQPSYVSLTICSTYVYHSETLLW